MAKYHNSLKEAWTPKQKENWENHGEPLVQGLQKLEEVAAGNGKDIDTSDALYWYLRTFRPKKRGDGMMKNEHVQIGEPEHLFVKELEDLSPTGFGMAGSIQGMMMASLGIDSDTQKRVSEAATKVFLGRNITSEQGRNRIRRVFGEQIERAKVYGLVD